MRRKRKIQEVDKKEKAAPSKKIKKEKCEEKETKPARKKTEKHQNRGSNVTFMFQKMFPGTTTIANVRSLSEFSNSIGIIACGKRYFGTGFAVGGKYVMTALHVVKAMLGLERCSNITLYQQIKIELGKQGARIDFNYVEEISDDPLEFSFIDTFLYIDKENDTAILRVDLDDDNEFPVSIQNFGDLQVGDVFEFIGHHDGKPKTWDINCRTKKVTKEEVDTWTGQLRRKYSLYPTDKPPYEGILKKGLDLFDCSFQHCGSGSPGFIIDTHGKVKVCTMLVRGYPNFFWNLTDDKKIGFNPKYRIECGIKMSAIYKKMSESKYPNTCSKIFQNCSFSTTIQD